jgi:CNT family concentrative nucleoside transporter
MLGNYIGIIGITVILGIALLLSTNRKAIRLRTVGAAFGLQVAVAAFVLYLDWGKGMIVFISRAVQAVIDFSGAGIDMVFGSLASESVGFSFAIHVLPVIIFFSALMSVMYHLKIMQWVVKLAGGALRKIIGTGRVESLNAAANIFIGQTEAPLVIRPYLKNVTEPQLFAIMVSGVASIAGTVLAGYVLMGAEIQYLLAASFMAAPGGLLMAKIIMPDDDTASSADDSGELVMEDSKHENVILAAAVGAGDGLKLAVNIGAMLIAFVALIALFNGIVGGIASLFGFEGVTMQYILGLIFKPLMFLLSVPWDEAQQAGALFGEKLILNEFVAFSHINDYLAGMSPRTVAIATFSLCGFANLSSIAILLGGLGVLVPEKRDLIAKFGMRAVAAGSLSNLMSAALAGLLLTF